MNYWMLLVIIGLTFDGHRVCSLIVTEINVPGIVDFRDNVTLSCSYNMAGHTLNSVKWYKDENEFFRYSPMMHPYYMKFPVEGAEVQENKHNCNSSICRIELGALGKKSSGVYRCEVSGDAPHFKLTTKAANMTVAALPQNNPLISGFHPMYHFDEFVTANCSSDYSSPPAILSWYINGELALPAELQPRQENTFAAHDYLLKRQILQIHFYVNGPRFIHFRKMLELKCVADIIGFPHLRRESKSSAVLTHDQNLNNQMLLSTGERSASSATIFAVSILRLAMSIIFLQSAIFS
ncbi:uncharacterized protein LOC129915280 [Episyrphus balteatus]|uniref:uncharacterized protein LOC129915280 n=1 Tax=Episyrphus balteatus TaxID=286459 RepID=UPI002484ED5F|nr:uncharacterized protein LOC129915280 [Episyrphus balteatus]